MDEEPREFQTEQKAGEQAKRVLIGTGKGLKKKIGQGGKPSERWQWKQDIPAGEEFQESRPKGEEGQKGQEERHERLQL